MFYEAKQALQKHHVQRTDERFFQDNNLRIILSPAKTLADEYHIPEYRAGVYGHAWVQDQQQRQFFALYN